MYPQDESNDVMVVFSDEEPAGECFVNMCEKSRVVSFWERLECEFNDCEHVIWLEESYRRHKGGKERVLFKFVTVRLRRVGVFMVAVRECA